MTIAIAAELEIRVGHGYFREYFPNIRACIICVDIMSRHNIEQNLSIVIAQSHN
jgi:hypothetical protein